jgi:hypothetical protein
MVRTALAIAALAASTLVHAADATTRIDLTCCYRWLKGAA